MTLLGAEVHIITFRHPGLPEREHKDGLTIWRVMDNPGDWESVRARLKQLGPDIIHVQSTSFLFPRWFYGIFIRNDFGCPIVVTVHESGSYRVFHILPFLKLLYDRANKVLVMSDRFARRLRRVYGVRPEKMRFIIHGVDIAKYDPTLASPASFMKRFGIDDGEFIILFFGFIRPQKGVEYLLDAYATVRKGIPHSRLVLLGSVRTSNKVDLVYFKSLRERAAQLGILPSTVFTGFLPEEMVVSAFSAASVVVLPYSEEGIPLEHSAVLQAAFAMGKPVVAVAPDVRSRIQLPVILSSPRRPDQLARAMMRVAGDAALRRELSTKATRVASEMSMRKAALQQLEIYKELVR